MKRRYILLLSALVLFTGAVIMTGCPANVKPQTPKYKVTLNSGKHGTVTVKPSLPADGMVEAHTRLSFTAQPDEGYEVDTWIMAAPRSADKKEAALTVAEKTTVTVTFKPKIKKYKIMLNKNEYGTVTVSPALPADGMVEQYKTLTFTATPNEGYEVEWTGAAPDNADKNKATLTVTADAVVTATFKKPGNSAEVQNYHVALSSGNNGTLIADTPLPADGMVAAGSTLTFTATPDFVYEVEAWTGAVPDPSDSTKATLTVTAHTTISVTFKKKQANIALLDIDAGGYLKGVIDKDALVGDLIIPDTVTSISDYAFADCQGLTSVTIPNGVTSIRQRTFQDCLNLTHITIPDSVTEIERWAFIGCSGLISITIPNGVTSIGSSAFEGCRKLTNIILPSSLTSIQSETFKDCKSLTNITIPNKVTVISSAAFENCVGLTQISIPSSVTIIQEQGFLLLFEIKASLYS
ncbi:leucine-rich repeat protein [Treponema vincentii]|uniref:leucine-rich repeat protein n=1 Tax=Treponema vincentii TaxID=69710 RepID=UPI0020A5DE78|nr:leucine-rich repeat protein [Treponema vincentii]UTC48373.1 leucine-rich repeat domain-containing protein [Treponema vincentii]